MRHIDIHLLLTFYKKRLHLSDQACCLILSENTGHMVTPDDLKLFLSSVQPNSKSLAKALYDEGFKAQQIAEIMNTTIYNVRYYLQEAKKFKNIKYVNPFWKMRFEENELHYQ